MEELLGDPYFGSLVYHATEVEPGVSSSSRGDPVNRSVWSFSVAARICPSLSFNATETIGSIAFDESEQPRMATAGIGRKIRVYDLHSVLDSSSGGVVGNADASAATVICTPARLSSVQWRAGQPSIIGSGDYDGVVTEWDVSRGIAVLERDEHDGRHVWSVDYSRGGDDLCVSSSDDGSARLWPPNTDRSAMALRSPGGQPVCCAEFSPESSQLVAMACADGAIYLYDLRKAGSPLVILAGHHQRAASYVRFLGQQTLVSASIDSSIVVWKLDKDHSARLVESFTGHRNVKNFVGLSVWGGGQLIASGSETNETFVYQAGGSDAACSAAIFKHELVRPTNSGSHRSSSSTLVSAVRWMQDSQSCGYASLLAAANSEGLVHIISGHKHNILSDTG